VSQAQTQLDAARSEAAQTLAQRALMEHAIAALLIVSASTFSIDPQIVSSTPPPQIIAARSSPRFSRSKTASPH